LRAWLCRISRNLTYDALRQQGREPNLCFRCAQFINDHWLWLMLLWLVPFLVQWRVAVRQNKAKLNRGG